MGRMTSKEYEDLAPVLSPIEDSGNSQSNPLILSERTTKRQRVYFNKENTIELDLPQFEAILSSSRSYPGDIFDLTNSNFPADEAGKIKYLRESGIGNALSLLEVNDEHQMQILDETVLLCNDLIDLDKGIKPIRRAPDRTVYDVFSLSVKGEQRHAKYGKSIDALIGVEKSRAFQALAQTHELQWGKLHYVYDKVEEIFFIKKSLPDGTSPIWLYTRPYSGALINERSMQRWKHFEMPN